MSDNVVARLRELLAAAYPTPWALEGYAGFTDGAMGWEITTAGSGQCIEGGDRSLFAPWEQPSAELIVEAVNALPAMLDVVERLAASDPMDWEMKQNRYPVCRICGAAIQSLDDHLPRCQWVAARRLCGLGGDA